MSKKFQWRQRWKNVPDHNVGTGVLSTEMSMRVHRENAEDTRKRWRWELHHNGVVCKGNVNDKVEAMQKAQDAYIAYLR
ncbi:hypothetical protein PsAD2_01045 [Pseudovibrio axinellae]|uniref:Uncharacterized protein n=1 Tax=Pseudovibrio axinellae TaxID=989403 RepID=A0A166AGW9_9HYPH|nr:hypothetical protein [Pseudovibrio axinellae]KZL21053.1 hypothetical protein PsAD2_01045 [Pseudovibrio axinellae]SEP77312.1 hypothetical protein SAMN05421798_101356 [Pseudovibrio axinellae]